MFVFDLNKKQFYETVVSGVRPQWLAGYIEKYFSAILKVWAWQFEIKMDVSGLVKCIFFKFLISFAYF